MFASAASVNVDLPIPGDPPMSTSDPGTIPPPRTRSSSAMPVPIRATCSASTSRNGVGRTALADALPPGPPPRGAETLRSSTSVFHSPQPGQRPCHFGLSCPHEEQAKTDAERATP
jgi:hypothetical protein